MIVPLLALALQAAQAQANPVDALTDPAFGAADDAWLHCRDRALTPAMAAQRNNRRAVDSAFAACAAEEAALRAVLVARLGEAEGGRTMEAISDFSRRMMLARAGAIRR